MNRYSTKSFPPYVFLPGKAVHPEKEGGYLHGHTIVAEVLTEQNYKECANYLYAIDLYNHGYYWESHVYWEAYWHQVGRKGKIAQTLQGLILLAACHVKKALAQEKAASGHYKRAQELFLSETIVGIDSVKLIEKEDARPIVLI